ncbi:MAG: hypothetical protein GY757_53665 [bacterium]|nr:hypothetical protein [bacterium]
MKEIRLKISDDMSKAQEEALLIKLFQTFEEHPANYLASLFSNEFTKWAAIRISNDFPLDVMEYITGHADDLDKLKDHNKELMQSIIALETDLDTKEQSTKQKLFDLKAEYEKRLKWETEQKEGAQREAKNLQRHLTAHEQAAKEMVEKSEERTAELERLSQEVDRLKVKLFDEIDKARSNRRVQIEIKDGELLDYKIDTGIDLIVINHDLPDLDPHKRLHATAGP